jgi:alpha-glucosidase (family GH31 glycosyl hydrolase)
MLTSRSQDGRFSKFEWPISGKSEMKNKTQSDSSRFVDFKVDQGVLRVEVVSANTFRIRLRADGEFKKATLHRYGILQQPDDAVPFKVEDRTIQTEAAALSIGESDGQLMLVDGSGKPLLREARAPWSDAQKGFGAEFHLEEQERLYGLGDVSRECLNRRGMSTLIWVKDVVSYVPVPFLMSNRGWGLLVNTTWKHHMDVGKAQHDRLRFGGNEGELDYYLFVGSTPATILDRYTDIAGKPTLLPLAAYGLMFVCNQQANAREMLDDCLNLRRAGIPCDWIGLEPGWMQKYQPAEQVVNTYDFSLEKTWHPERFYIPTWLQKGPGMFIDVARRMGFKLSLWMCCDYDLSYEEERRAGKEADHKEQASAADVSFHEDAVEHDVLLQTTVLMDKTTRPDEPWFEHLKKFVDEGAAAFKLDGAMQVLEHPDRKWANGMDDREMHNLYPLIYDKQMYQGFAEHTGRRPMIYSAGGYTGVQQFVATWAGDTGGGPKPLVSLLNHGLSGHANTSCDMEVFTPAGIHFGFFQPWSQVCSWAYWRHPWMLGDELLPIFQFYSRLRYRLMPYIYSAAHVAHRTGLPIVRAMPLAFPEDSKSDELLGQYMFGDSFLVAAFTDQVHLPAGRWIDYWTQELHEGPKDLVYPAPPGRGGALFVRQGAIIPQWPQMDYVGQKSTQRLTLDIYPAESSEFILYEDDGLSLDYQRGAVATTRFTCARYENEIEINIGARQGAYEGMPQERMYEVHVYGQSPVSLSIDGKEPAEFASGDDWRYDEPARRICVSVSENPKRDRAIRIRCRVGDAD